jgi:uncharacterized membrane protein/protein-disulfide isomerase
MGRRYISASTRHGAGAAAALGMAVVAALTVRHWFSVQFPRGFADATACGAASFFSCLDSANAPIAAPFGIPLGVYGVMVGGLLLLAALFPSPDFDRFARRISVLNVTLAVALSAYSMLVLRSLCPLCFSYTALSILHVLLVGSGAAAREGVIAAGAEARPFALTSLRYLAAFGLVTLLAGWSVSVHRDARVEARSGGAAEQMAAAFLGLERVPEPTLISPYRAISSTPRFEDAAVRMVVYGDFLCTDCRYFAEQLHRLEREFPGQINAAFQFFPLEAQCNDVVSKDKHPGACDLAYISAYRPEQFRAIHDEIFASGEQARRRGWQLDLARRYAAEAALQDPATRSVVHQLIATGTEYEKTSEQFSHGIRSTPTSIVNGRMLIGTLPYEHLRAIVVALLRERGGGQRFLENWTDIP